MIIMKSCIAPALVAIAFASSPAIAQEAMTAQSLADCMIENSTDTNEDLLKDMMIKALQDAPEAELMSSTIAMGMGMVTLATTNCGLDLAGLDSPTFENAAELYGTYMGEKIMGDAMAKIGG